MSITLDLPMSTVDRNILIKVKIFGVSGFIVKRSFLQMTATVIDDNFADEQLNVIA